MGEMKIGGNGEKWGCNQSPVSPHGVGRDTGSLLLTQQFGGFIAYQRLIVASLGHTSKARTLHFHYHALCRYKTEQQLSLLGHPFLSFILCPFQG